MELGYIQLMRYSEDFDEKHDGEWRALTRLDVLAAFGHLVKGSKTKLFLNGNVSAGEASDLVQAGKLDAVVIGRSFINNPECVIFGLCEGNSLAESDPVLPCCASLPKRLFAGLPLNEDLGVQLNVPAFYQYEEDMSEGFVSLAVPADFGWLPVQRTDPGHDGTVIIRPTTLPTRRRSPSLEVARSEMCRLRSAPIDI